MATENCTAVSYLALGARFRPARVCGKRRLRSEVNPPTPAISKLGDDLLTEILVRGFPDPRSACRSRAVCKQWRSLISDPCFGRRFLSYHQSINKHPPPKLLHSTDTKSVSLSFIPWPADCASNIQLELASFAVFDCFKDLLLCGFGELGYRHTSAELGRTYLLCNPFTKQWMALPLAPDRPVGHSGLRARLVCEPLDSNSLIFNLGGGTEYRFRVVCVYQDANSMKLDVFSSESGEWTREAFVLEGYCRPKLNNVVSCDGVLYLSYARAQGNHDGLSEPLIAAINPFRLDIPPTPIDVSPVSANNPWWDISISQGAVHLIVFEEGTRPASSRIVLSVWRLNEDCKFWRKVCAGLVKSSSDGNYQPGSLYVPTLHPEKPETVFFTLRHSYLSCECDLSRGGQLEFFAKPAQHCSGWRVFQPKVSCWPTPIPKYQKLRVRYDGIFDCWDQFDEPEPITPLITGTYVTSTSENLPFEQIEEWPPVDGVVQSCHSKKLKRG